MSWIIFHSESNFVKLFGADLTMNCTGIRPRTRPAFYEGRESKLKACVWKKNDTDFVIMSLCFEKCRRHLIWKFVQSGMKMGQEKTTTFLWSILKKSANQLGWLFCWYLLWCLFLPWHQEQLLRKSLQETQKVSKADIKFKKTFVQIFHWQDRMSL